MTLRLFQVDAFASRPFEGNPAAVCPLNEWLDDQFLQSVATENNLSETAYFVRRGDDFELRWFTPKAEIKLCGHATLASAFVLFTILEPGRESVRFETRYSGTLTVRRSKDSLVMDFPALPPKICLNAPEILFRALRAKPAEVLENNQKYIAVFDSEETIRQIRPNFTLLKQLHPYTVAITAAGTNCDFVSRYFVPSYGIDEDPVTGSSHCALTPYWAERLGKKRLHARQLSERGGELWCELARDRVMLEGKAVLVLQGTLLV
jgi:PhzF family phenazine biosynthesis protein